MGAHEYLRLSARGVPEGAATTRPEIRDADCFPAVRVRAQSVTPEGALVERLRILEAPGAIHVLNAHRRSHRVSGDRPSPATLAIAFRLST